MEEIGAPAKVVAHTGYGEAVRVFDLGPRLRKNKWESWREPEGQVQYEKRKLEDTRSEIEHLAAWLQHQISEVVMESTAQYWRPVWCGLEAHFRLHLTHPLKTRAPRGRKCDFRDAQPVLHQEVDYQEKGRAPQNLNTLFRKLRRLTREFAAQGIDVSDLLSPPANAATA